MYAKNLSLVFVAILFETKETFFYSSNKKACQAMQIYSDTAI